jgi:phosphoribosylamine--glycine ligase
VVVEDFLEGVELSVFIITDGRDYLLLPEARDYKRVGEGDTGPNTGGMGAHFSGALRNAGGDAANLQRSD